MKNILKFGRINKWYYIINKNILAVKLTNKAVENNMIALPYTQKHGDYLLNFFNYKIGEPKQDLIFESEKTNIHRIQISTELKEHTKRKTDLCRLKWDKEFGSYLRNIDIEKYRNEIDRARSKGYEYPLFYLEIKKTSKNTFYVTNKKPSTQFWYSDKKDNTIILNEYKNLLLKFPNKTDSETLSIHRKEQHLLRQLLFNGKLKSKCGICSNSFPIELIWCAHIKKRSECTLDERLDFENIIMPMCKFGCDDLYEKQYIYVDNGIVKINKSNKNWTNDLLFVVEKIENKDINSRYFKKNSIKYFEWHKKNIFN